MESKYYKKLRSVKDGKSKELKADDWNVKSLKVRASELNRVDGYRHYTIAYSQKFNRLRISAHANI